MTRATPLWLMGLFLLGMPIVHTSSAAEQNELNAQVVTGTLSKLDLPRGKGQVTTDLGKPIFFEVTKPHLFEHLSVGARVTVEIDDDGRANKIIDASMAEFVPPPSGEIDSGSFQPAGVLTVGMVR